MQPRATFVGSGGGHVMTECSFAARERADGRICHAALDMRCGELLIG